MFSHRMYLSCLRACRYRGTLQRTHGVRRRMYNYKHKLSLSIGASQQSHGLRTKIRDITEIIPNEEIR